MDRRTARNVWADRHGEPKGDVMDERELLIYGAGGHGLVVAESAEAAGWTVWGFLDDRVPKDTTVGRWRVIGRGDGERGVGVNNWFERGVGDRAGRTGEVIVAVGDNAARWHLLNVLRGAEVRLATVVDPSARVSPSARLEPGVYVGPNAVVNAEATVGPGCIINSAAVVEHHVQLEAGVHVGPAAVLCGAAEAGERSLIGANATVLPGRTVGEQATLGAGSVATTDIPARTTAVGSPAKPVQE